MANCWNCNASIWRWLKWNPSVTPQIWKWRTFKKPEDEPIVRRGIDGVRWLLDRPRDCTILSRSASIDRAINVQLCHHWHTPPIIKYFYLVYVLNSLQYLSVKYNLTYKQLLSSVLNLFEYRSVVVIISKH